MYLYRIHYFLKCIRRILIVAFCSLLLSSPTLIARTLGSPDSPTVQLAKVYAQQDVQEYLISEKFDGIRATWHNRRLRTRRGNTIYAPSWFTASLPNISLDGELWFERGNFEYVASTVSKLQPIDEEWKNITFMVFDAPGLEADFQTRAKFYTALLGELNLSHIQAVKQFTVNTNAELSSLLKIYTTQGAEGLMLHKADAMHAQGRSGNILKLKQYMDAEATILDYMPGKGKYVNQLGALFVQYENELGQTIKFKIGSGFSDFERANPPPIGSLITFKYYGLTTHGVPRFASYLREYPQDE